VQALAGLAAAAAAEGPLPAAVRLLSAVAALDPGAQPAHAGLGIALDDSIRLARAQMRPASFEAAWASGQSLAAEGPAAIRAYAADLAGSASSQSL
jgi:hypothetical protein